MRKIVVAAVALAVSLALAGCTAGAAPRHLTSSDQKYGSLPSFLPKDTTHPDSTLDGSIADPAITSQGDSVRVEFGSGSALVSVLGPVVPGRACRTRRPRPPAPGPSR